MAETLQDVAFARTMVKEATQLHEAGNLGAAEQRYRMVIEHGYRTAEVLPILADILGLRCANDEALTVWDALLQVDPDHGISHHEKGLIYSRTGHYDLAVIALQASCAADPNHPVSTNNLAVILADAGRKTEALPQFQHALELQPGDIHIEHQIR